MKLTLKFYFFILFSVISIQIFSQPRINETLAEVNNQIFLFGGSDTNGVPLNDLWKFDLQNDKWIEIKPNGAIPPARAGHSVAVSSASGKSKMYIFFGVGNGWLDDIWSYDPESNTWTKEPSTGEVPSGRRYHTTTTLMDSTIFLFGGQAITNADKAYVYNPATGEWKMKKGSFPDDARENHCAFLGAEGDPYIFGGYDKFSDVSSSLYRYHLDTDTWEDITQTSPVKEKGIADTPWPSGRAGAAYASDRNNAYVIGGINYYNKSASKEVWKYKKKEKTWEKMGTTSQYHISSVAAIAKDANGNSKSIVVFGGSDYQTTSKIQLVKYSLTVNVTPEDAEKAGCKVTHTDYSNGGYTTITATPAKGWEFEGWSGDASGKDKEITIVMDSDKTITAKFKKILKYKLKIVILPEKGSDKCYTIPGKGTYEYAAGEEVKIEAKVERSGLLPVFWQFKNWTGDVKSTDEKITVKMDDDKVVIANFIEVGLLIAGKEEMDNRCPCLQKPNTEMLSLPFTLSASKTDGWKVTGINFRTAGSGNEQKDISKVEIFRNKDLLYTGKFLSDNGKIKAKFVPPIVIQPNSGVVLKLKYYSAFDPKVYARDTTKTFYVKTVSIDAVPLSSEDGVISGMAYHDTLSYARVWANADDLLYPKGFPTINKALDYIAKNSSAKSAYISVCPGLYKTNLKIDNRFDKTRIELSEHTHGLLPPILAPKNLNEPIIFVSNKAGATIDAFIIGNTFPQSVQSQKNSIGVYVKSVKEFDEISKKPGVSISATNFINLDIGVVTDTGNVSIKESAFYDGIRLPIWANNSNGIQITKNKFFPNASLDSINIIIKKSTCFEEEIKLNKFIKMENAIVLINSREVSVKDNDFKGTIKLPIWANQVSFINISKNEFNPYEFVNMMDNAIVFNKSQCILIKKNSFHDGIEHSILTNYSDSINIEQNEFCPNTSLYSINIKGSKRITINNNNVMDITNKNIGLSIKFDNSSNGTVTWNNKKNLHYKNIFRLEKNSSKINFANNYNFTVYIGEGCSKDSISNNSLLEVVASNYGEENYIIHNSIERSNSYGILLEGNENRAKKILVLDNKIRYNRLGGIKTLYGYPTISNNEIIKNGNDGIYIEKPLSLFISMNIIKEQVTPISNFIPAGIRITDYKHQNIPAIIDDNLITHNYSGLKITNSDKIIIMGNTIKNNLASNTGIHLDNSSADIRGNNISNNNGNGILAKNNSHPTVSFNNITGNAEFGLKNENSEEALSANNNFWGSSNGPGEKGVSGNIKVDKWLGSGVSVVVSPARDTLFVTAGMKDSTFINMQNLLHPTDKLKFSVSDDKGWITAVNNKEIALQDSMGYSYVVKYSVPSGISSNDISKVDFTVKSEADSAEVAGSFYLATYQPVVKRIEISLTNSTLLFGDTLNLAANALDQFGNGIITDFNWSASKGKIDSTGKFVAPNTEGEIIVSAAANGVVGKAKIFVSKVAAQLVAVKISPDTITVSSREVVHYSVKGLNQFGYPFTFTPVWSVSGGGDIDDYGTFIADSISGTYNVIVSNIENTVSDTAVVIVKGTTDVEEEIIPEEYTLYQNYPNPFNPSTTISYALPYDSKVQLEIFNILGQRVALIVNEKESVGFHSKVWDAGHLASGVYIVRINAVSLNGNNNFTKSVKMILLK